MNRAYLPVVKSMFVALLALSATAFAADEPKADAAKAAAKADPAKGSALYSSGDAARGIPACVSCHGDNGNSNISTNPKLAGQHEAYLAKQLHNFAGKDRVNAIMSGYAKQLQEDEIKNLAAFLSAQAPKAGAAKNKDTVEIGKKIYRAGIAEKNVPACAGCHGPNGAGIPAQFARLAGQHQDYTLAQLTAFSGGQRSNSPQMVTISKRLSQDEMKAVADYVAGLK